VSDLWPWLAVFALGLFHGVNPAMGWLFAVALGLQEHKRAAVLCALLPIALGHALSIGIIIAAVLVARVSLPYSALKYSAAAILFAFGLYRLFRSRHPNWVGMRVGFGDLTLWSFIMASAHGAGLMLIPLFLKSTDAPVVPATNPIGYLLATGLVAMLVYEKLGVGLLRHAWFNIDLFWMLALMIAGLVILFL